MINREGTSFRKCFQLRSYSKLRISFLRSNSNRHVWYRSNLAICQITMNFFNGHFFKHFLYEFERMVTI